jgi:hypothetical protein
MKLPPTLNIMYFGFITLFIDGSKSSCMGDPLIVCYDFKVLRNGGSALYPLDQGSL